MEKVRNSESGSIIIERLLSEGATYRDALSVDGLLDSIRRQTARVREEHPELRNHALYDATLAVSEGGLIVRLHFRR